MAPKKMAFLCDRTERTIREWRNEKSHMPYACVALLSRKSRVPIPDSMRIVNRHALASTAGKKGYAMTMKRYGKMPIDESYRKEQWEAWWEKTGKLLALTLLEPKRISFPRKSARLAEMMGILMGDGGMSEYQITISLHSMEDAAYARYVSRLLEELFSVTPTIRRHAVNRVMTLTISRVLLVRFLNGLGLPVGNKIKQGLDMPRWIRARTSYARACMRGLVDTDGCIFTHRYRVRETPYSYKKLSFSSASPPLIYSVAQTMRGLGLTPRIAKKGREVRLDRNGDVRRYMKLVGSSNRKHLKRFAA
jgi:hypothetical protein